MPLRNHLLLVLPWLLFTAHVTKPEMPSNFRPGKDFALFFAVSKYDQWDKLQNPVKDAEAIAGDLNKYYAFDTLVVRNPTYDQVIEVLNHYAARKYADDGQLFVFFTGHGYLNSVKEGFFVPKDGQKNDQSQRSYLAHNRIAYLVNNISCKHILLGIDACYSGSFMRTIQQKGDIGKRPGETDAAVKERFIQDMLQYKSRLVITSGGEVPTNDNSQFARQILAALRSHGDNGILDFYGLVSYLQSARPMPRHGEFGDNEAGGQFLFLYNAPATPEKKGSTDSDGDGIPDASDACPQDFGTAKARGCPDADDDGVPDQSDKCKYAAGEARWQGCPDTDGDGIPDHDDKCPREKGEIALEGCPRADNMVFIRGGAFQMGSTDGEDDEKPVHSATVSDFYLSKYEVTVAEFRAFVEASGYLTDAEKEGWSWVYNRKEWVKENGRNWRHDPEGKTADDNHPVINVSWNDATEYCKWLSQKTGKAYRLPTEAEWEYAAGNGDKHIKYSWGNAAPAGRKGGSLSDETAAKKFNWTRSNANIFMNYDDGFASTAPVGSFDPNEFGLYDMTGNVNEWCSDWYGSKYYKNSLPSNPTGPSSGSYRVLRGGSWNNDPQYMRVACRGNGTPAYRNFNVGFRLARTF